MKLRQLLSTLVITAGLIVTVGLVQQRQLFQKKAAPAEAETSLSFIHQDHLGSIAMVTDSSGRMISQEAYYPYGTVRSTSGDSPTERGYTGQVSDSQETGLLYYNARYYDPVIAKFTQADKANDDLNRYAYVGGNPIVYNDPSGNSANFPCWTGNCNKPTFEFDYSDLGLGRLGNSIAMTLVEIVAMPVCWLGIGCHVDLANNVITGPTQIELYESNAIAFGTAGFPGVGDDVVNLADDVADLVNLKNNIISGVEGGGTNVTTRLANPVIDQMIARGSNEMDAITLVGNNLAPPYSLDSALLGQANLARSADELIGCPAAICRHNQMITRDIAASRGLDPYLGWLRGEQNGLPWSHGVSVLYDQAGVPSVIDPTNFNQAFGISDYVSALSDYGISVNSFTASSFSNWNVENKLIPK